MTRVFKGKSLPRPIKDLVTPYGYGGGVVEGEKDAAALKEYRAA